MNRKNIILIAVLINAGLLAVLVLAAMTTQEELPLQTAQIAKEEAIHPKFDEVPLYQELILPEPPKNEMVSAEPPLIHKLPSLVDSPALPEPPPASIAVLPAPPIQAPSQAVNEIIVKKGDSLEKLARNHHTMIEEIVKLNHLPSTFLKIGQVLKIPAEKTFVKAVEKKGESGPEYYTMKVGENPWAIAIRHHMKVEELLRLNGLNEEKARKLKPGDRLRIR